MIARGSTRLTVPVMSSPSRLRELVEDLVALDLADALEDDLLGGLGADAAEDVAVELLGLDQVADLGVGLDALTASSTVISVSSSSISSTTRRARKTRMRPDLGVDPDVDVLVAGHAPIRRLDAVLDGPDQLLTRDLLLRVELEEGADEVSTHDRLLCCRMRARERPVQKKTWGSPTSRSGRSVGPKYTPGWVDGSNGGRPGYVPASPSAMLA